MYVVFNIKALVFILELDLFFNGSNMKPDLNIRPNLMMGQQCDDFSVIVMTEVF